MLQFKNHAEKDFWQEVYVKLCEHYGNEGAVLAADQAVESRRPRMKELALGQKPPDNMNLPE